MTTQLDGTIIRLEQSPTEKIGGMICLYIEPSIADELALDGGERPEDLHITLCVLAPSLVVHRDEILEVAKTVVSRHKTLRGLVGGAGRFVSTHKAGKHAYFAIPDVIGLADLYTDLMTEMKKAGYAPIENHGFSPHITLAFLDEDEANPADEVQTLPIVCDHVSVVLGDERVNLELAGREPTLSSVKSSRRLLRKSEVTTPEILRTAKPNHPLPAQFYNLPSQLNSRPKMYGYSQFHWRGMVSKSDPFTGHSVHCDVRLQLPRTLGSELIQWVLAGKQDKIIRGVLGLDNGIDGPKQTLMAIVKPSALEAGERIRRKIAKMSIEGVAQFEFIKADLAGLASKAYPTAISLEELKRLATRGDIKLESGETLAFPLRGYWMTPDDPANMEGKGKTWAFLQLIEVFEWELGVQRKNAHEYFFRGKYFDGRYTLRLLEDKKSEEGDKYWLWSRPDDELPLDPTEHKDEGVIWPLEPGRTGTERPG